MNHDEFETLVYGFSMQTCVKYKIQNATMGWNHTWNEASWTIVSIITVSFCTYFFFLLVFISFDYLASFVVY